MRHELRKEAGNMGNRRVKWICFQECIGYIGIGNRQSGLYLHIEIQVIWTVTVEAQIKISKLQRLVLGCIPSLTVFLLTFI